MTNKIAVDYVRIRSLAVDYAKVDARAETAGVADVEIKFVGGGFSSVSLPVVVFTTERDIFIHVKTDGTMQADWSFGVAHDAYRKTYGLGEMADRADEVFDLSIDVEIAVENALRRPDLDEIDARRRLIGLDLDLSLLWQYGYWDEDDLAAEIESYNKDGIASSIIHEIDEQGIDLDTLDIDGFKDIVNDQIGARFLSIERAGFDGDPERDCYRAVITTGGPHIEAQIFFGQKAELVYRNWGFTYRKTMSDEAENALRYACGCDGY